MSVPVRLPLNVHVVLSFTSGLRGRVVKTSRFETTRPSLLLLLLTVVKPKLWQRSTLLQKVAGSLPGTICSSSCGN